MPSENQKCWRAFLRPAPAAKLPHYYRPMPSLPAFPNNGCDTAPFLPSPSDPRRHCAAGTSQYRPSIPAKGRNDPRTLSGTGQDVRPRRHHRWHRQFLVALLPMTGSSFDRRVLVHGLPHHVFFLPRLEAGLRSLPMTMPREISVAMHAPVVQLTAAGPGPVSAMVAGATGAVRGKMTPSTPRRRRERMRLEEEDAW